MKTVGRTSDGKLVVTEVFKFYETEGLPLDVILETLRDQNMMPDWMDFMLEAVRAKMKIPRILAMLDAAITDSYGSELRDVVISRLKYLTRNHPAV